MNTYGLAPYSKVLPDKRFYLDEGPLAKEYPEYFRARGSDIKYQYAEVLRGAAAYTGPILTDPQNKKKYREQYFFAWISTSSKEMLKIYAVKYESDYSAPKQDLFEIPVDITPKDLGYSDPPYNLTPDKHWDVCGMTVQGDRLYIYCLMSKDEGESVPIVSKIVIFDLSGLSYLTVSIAGLPDRQVGGLFAKNKIGEILVDNVDNAELSSQLRHHSITSTWSHLFLVDNTQSAAVKFNAYSLWDHKRDAPASYSINKTRSNGITTTFYGRQSITGFFMTDSFLFYARDNSSSVYLFDYTNGYRPIPSQSDSEKGKKIRYHFYDLAWGSKLLLNLYPAYLTPLSNALQKVYSARYKILDIYFNYEFDLTIKSAYVLYGIKDEANRGILKTRPGGILFFGKGKEDEDGKTIKPFAPNTFVKGKIIPSTDDPPGKDITLPDEITLVMPPPLLPKEERKLDDKGVPVSDDDGNPVFVAVEKILDTYFISMSGDPSPNGSKLYAIVETKIETGTGVQKETIYKKRLVTYEILAKKREDILADDFNSADNDNFLKLVENSTSVSFEVPTLSLSDGVDNNYGATTQEAWGITGVRMYRKDPKKDKYRFLKDEVTNPIEVINPIAFTNPIKVTIPDVTPIQVTPIEVAPIKSAFYRYTLTDDTVGPDAVGLEAKSELYITDKSYDGDPDYGNLTPPKAKLVSVGGGRLLLGDIETNAVVLDNVPKKAVFTGRLYYSALSSVGAYPNGNFAYIDRDLTYVGNIKSNIVIASNDKIYRVNLQNFQAVEYGSISGITGPYAATLTPYGLFYASLDGIYYTDGFNINKISDHINDLYTKIQRKDVIFSYYSKIYTRVYFFYHDQILETSYFNKGLILDLLHTNLKLRDGGCFTQYKEVSNIWPQQFNILGLFWVNYKGKDYKGNQDGTVSEYIHDVINREVLWKAGVTKEVVQVPVPYTFESAGLIFQSSWLKKHIHRLTANISATGGGSIHFYGISEGGKSRVDLEDIDLKEVGIFNDDRLTATDISLRPKEIVSRVWQLSAKGRTVTFYQVGFTNGLSLEHKGGTGQWQLIDNGGWDWKTFVGDSTNGAWDSRPTEEGFSIYTSKIVPSRPRLFNKKTPFLNFIMVITSIRDASSFAGNDVNKQAALDSVLKELVGEHLFLSELTSLLLNRNTHAIQSVPKWHIDKSLSNFIDNRLYTLSKSPTKGFSFNPYGIYIQGVNPPPKPDPKDIGIDHTFTDGSIEHYEGPFEFDFSLYSHRGMDFQLLDLTVMGASGGPTHHGPPNQGAL